MKFVTSVLLALGCLVQLPALASDWPQKAVRIVVPYPAGGAVDSVMRTVGERMAKSLGQPVVVENRPGASSNIGAAAVANAAPDGYTVLATSQWLTLNPLIEKTLQWKESDLAPVARLAKAPNYLAVGPDSPAKTLQEYVEQARKQPGLFYGSTGVGSTQELAMASLISSAGIRLEPVLYKGAPPIIVDLISGRLSIAAMAAANVGSHAKSGQLRLLANSSDTRSPNQPDVPTLMELGYSKVDIASWYGLQVPRGTPKGVIDKLEQSSREAMADPAVQERLAKMDVQGAYLPSGEFAAFLDAERTRWKPVVESMVPGPQR